jgi:hypothetical protein
MIILPPTQPSRTRQELANYVVSSIESAGVKVPQSSRLRRMRDLWSSGNSVIQPDDPKFEIACESSRDMQLLGFVFDQFGQSEKSISFLKLLRYLVKDSVLPQLDKLHSKGRDSAFELFTAAVCKSARFDPVVFEEPDVTCSLNGVVYGLASKRIKSINSIEQRVRSGVDQILRTGHQGVVVIDTCLAFNPSNERVVPPIANSLFMARYLKTLRMMWSKFQPNMQQIMSKASNVLGIIVHDYQVRQTLDSDWELTGMTMRVPALSRTSDKQREFEKFATIYTYALPNQEDVGNPALSLP